MSNRRIVTIHAVDEKTFSPQRFIRYIKVMRFLGYKFVSVNEILSKKKGKKLIALTIDDGYKCCIHNLLPLLNKMKIPALIFLPMGLLNLKRDNYQLKKSECYPEQDMMSDDDVNLWINEGYDIGYHTHKHLDLYHAQNNQIITDDFINGIQFMNKKGWKTNYFAYPKGFLPKDRTSFEKLLKENDIEYAFTINWGNVNDESPFYINRVCLGNKENFIWTILKSIGLVDSYFYNRRITKEQII